MGNRDVAEREFQVLIVIVGHLSADVAGIGVTGGQFIGVEVKPLKENVSRSEFAHHGRLIGPAGAQVGGRPRAGVGGTADEAKEIVAIELERLSSCRQIQS